MEETQRHLSEANDQLLAERREHVAAMVVMQERLSEMEKLKTAAETREAQVDAARAQAVSEALHRQSIAYEESLEKLRVEVRRLQALASAAENDRSEMRSEVERVRAVGEERLQQAEAAAREHEQRELASLEAHVRALQKEKHEQAEAHRETMARQREAEQARWAQHEIKLQAARDEILNLEGELAMKCSEVDMAQLELARLEGDIMEAKKVESQLRDQLSATKAAANEQQAVMRADAEAVRRGWEGRLEAADAEKHEIERQLADTKRELQQARAKVEVMMRSLQTRVSQCIDEAVSGFIVEQPREG